MEEYVPLITVIAISLIADLIITSRSAPGVIARSAVYFARFLCACAVYLLVLDVVARFPQANVSSPSLQTSILGIATIVGTYTLQKRVVHRLIAMLSGLREVAAKSRESGSNAQQNHEYQAAGARNYRSPAAQQNAEPDEQESGHPPKLGDPTDSETVAANTNGILRGLKQRVYRGDRQFQVGNWRFDPGLPQNDDAE